MGAGGYFTLAVLVVVLIPAVAISLEGRRMPEFLYPAIALCGMASSGLRGGWLALGGAFLAGLIVLLLVGGAITALRSSMRLRLLTGGQIKLMAAGATWLGPVGAAAMILIAGFALFAMAAWQQAMQREQQRPDSVIIVALAIMSVAMEQQFAS
jgi:prepilin signal peptidase PulO-like enzyme (type II secretory pathway)